VIRRDFTRAATVTLLSIAALYISGCETTGRSVRLDASLQKDVRTLGGIEYVPLERLCDVYGVKRAYDRYIHTVTLEKGGQVVARAGGATILVNGAQKKLNAPVKQEGGLFLVPTSFAGNVISAILKEEHAQHAAQAPAAPTVTPSASMREPGALKRYTIRTVVIDPGHGGKDAGAIGRRLRLKEKALALGVAKRLKNILEENGIRVIMTRSSDVFIPLEKRVRIANAAGADLFVSVHINASRSRFMRGFECYYLSDATDDNARALEALENGSLALRDAQILQHSRGLDTTLWDMALSENRKESRDCAQYICDAVDSNFAARNRGVKTARFFVLKGARMPSVLVEVGYLSNKYEEKKLADGRSLENITDVVAKGILAYRDEFERTEGFTR